MGKRKTKQLPFVLGMKLLSLYSFVLGLGLLSVCFWTLFALSEGNEWQYSHEQNMTRNSSKGGSPKPERFVATSVYLHERRLSNVNDTEIQAVVDKIKHAWGNLSPYFAGSIGGAICCGFIQIGMSIIILFSSSSGTIKKSRCWEFTHILLCAAFSVCVIIPKTVDMTQKDGGIWAHVKNLPENTKLNLEDVHNMFLLYVSLLINIGGILLSIFISRCFISRLKSKVVTGKIIQDLNVYN